MTDKNPPMETSSRAGEAARPRNGRRKLLTSLIALAIVFVGVAVFMRSRDRKDEPKYRTEAVERGGVKMTITATGTLSAVTTVQVGSQISGVISRIYVDFNSRVEKGQLLAELDPTPFQAAVEQRRADLTKATVDLTNARLQFQRQKRLLAEGLASQAEVDAVTAGYESARAQVAQSQAGLRQAETNLRYTKILSPIAGVVADRQYDVGQTVAASFQAPTLFTIAQDLTKMQLQSDVDQSDIGRVRMGQEIRFTVDAYPEEEFRGQVSQLRLNATVNQNVVSYPVIIAVDNSDGRLRPKMTANVTIDVAEVSNVLRIPNAALRFRPTPDKSKGGSGERRAVGGGFERGAAAAGERSRGMGGAGGALEQGRSRKPGGGQTVYILEGEKLVPVPVKTGITDGRYTEIKESRLEPGDKVVIGLVTAKVEDTQSRPPGMGGRGGGRF